MKPLDPDEPAGWMSVRRWAALTGQKVGSARVRAWRILTRGNQDPDWVVAQTFPSEERSSVQVRRRRPEEAL